MNIGKNRYNLFIFFQDVYTLLAMESSKLEIQNPKQSFLINPKSQFQNPKQMYYFWICDFGFIWDLVVFEFWIFSLFLISIFGPPCRALGFAARRAGEAGIRISDLLYLTFHLSLKTCNFLL